METLEGEASDADMVHLKFGILKSRLTMIPPSFFEHMSALQLLDLSRTSIQSLPPSISKLSSLEELILQECLMLMELPPEVGRLKNLKLFDLEGTEIMYLPEEMGKLENLECLRVSLCAYADEYKDRNGIEHIIPRMIISKFSKLKELSVSVNPDAKWWKVEVLEAILEKLSLLPCLKTLKLYLPTARELQYFLSLESCQLPIYSNLWNFRLMIGHSEQLTSSLPFDLVENFEKLEKCFKYVNGEGSTDDITELIRNAKALFLCCHWTIEKLSIFDISRLKYCLLAECNEMQTIVNTEELYGDKNIVRDNGEKDPFGSLQYLAIHFMKKLQSIWKGPVARDSLSCLKILALHTCPELTTIFTECMLDNLHSLTEIIVEDCPKVNSLVCPGSTPWRYGPFLPNLRRVLLLDLPELVSISSSVCIAPRLDVLLIFNCLKLNYLSVMELPRDIKEIKGEIEWWDALKYGQSEWSRVFVPLKRDGDLMDQLAEDTNSLKHFHELQNISPHQGEASSMSGSTFVPSDSQPLPSQLSRYESQEHRNMKIFGQYLKNQRPPVALSHCNSGHVIEFLKNLDQFGKTKVHIKGCVFYGHPYPAATCFCPLRQAWGTLDALIGRLHAAYEENVGLPEMNPFASKAVQFYLSEVRESQEKALGIPCKKKHSSILKVEEISNFRCRSHIIVSNKKGKDDDKKPFDSTRQRRAPDVEAVQTIMKENRTLLSPRAGDLSSGTIYSERQGFSSSGGKTERCSKLIEPPQEMISSDGQGSSSADTGTEAFRKLTIPPRQAIDIILFWGSTAERKIYVFDTHRREIDQYLGAVDEIQSWLNSAAASDDLSKVKSTMQLAMSRLTDEFRTILQVKAKSKEHSSSVNPSSTTFQVTMTEGASSNHEVQDDDCVGSYTMSTEVISDLRSIAVRANSAGCIHDFADVYICERKPIMQRRFQRLNIQKLNRYSAQRLEWGVLESMIEVWFKSANICFKYLFVSEKQLCEQIFQGLGKNTEVVCFVVTVQDYVIQLFNIPHALSFVRPTHDKLFRILDLYETLSGLSPQINKLFPTQSSEFLGATRMLRKLADKIKKILSEFEKALLDQESSVICVGPIHPLPRYVMGYLYKLCDHKHTLMELSLSELPSVDGVGLSLEIEELKEQSELSHHVIWIMTTLVSNLESKAKLCEDGSAGHFFAMKNIHYIIQKIEGQPELMEVVGDDYLGKLIQKLDEAKVKYLILELEKIREMRDY